MLMPVEAGARSPAGVHSCMYCSSIPGVALIIPAQSAVRGPSLSAPRQPLGLAALAASQLQHLMCVRGFAGGLTDEYKWSTILNWWMESSSGRAWNCSHLADRPFVGLLLLAPACRRHVSASAAAAAAPPTAARMSSVGFEFAMLGYYSALASRAASVPTATRRVPIV